MGRWVLSLPHHYLARVCHDCTSPIVHSIHTSPASCCKLCCRCTSCQPGIYQANLQEIGYFCAWLATMLAAAPLYITTTTCTNVLC